jgi:hypothetical protein
VFSPLRRIDDEILAVGMRMHIATYIRGCPIVGIENP